MNYEGLYATEYKIINGEPIIFLFQRLENGEKKVEQIKGFKPYFYVDSEALAHNGISNKIVYIEPQEYITIYSNKVRKCYVNKPSDIYYAREFYEQQDLYESDVLFNERFMINCVDEIKKTSYMIATIDIETDVSKSFPKWETPVEPIICISIHDNYSDKIKTFVWREDLEKKEENDIYYFNNEIEMLTEFLNYWHTLNPDIICGWNLISFDIKYLLNRMKLLNINYQKLSPMDSSNFDVIINKETGEDTNKSVIIRPKGEPSILGITLFDALTAYKRLTFGEMTSFSLGNVAELTLGEKKDKQFNTGEVWRKDIDSLIKYNRHDVDLTLKIEAKKKLITLFDEIRRFSGCANLSDCFFMSRVHDIRMLKKYKDKYVFPSKAAYKEKTEEERIEGAWVMSKPGLYDNIAMLDYSGLYPNIIKTFNLSPEMISEDGVEINGVKIRQDKVGIMPSLIDDLLQLKNDLKKQIAGTGQDLRDAMFVVKIFVNSIWGIFALNSFRMYDKRLANNVTFLGRYLIKKATKIIEEEFKYEVVLNDTDSCAIVIPEGKDAITEGNKIKDRINQVLEQDIPTEFKVQKSTIKIEFEKVCKRMLLHKKKHYAGWITWEDGEEKDYIKHAGLSTRRCIVGSTPLILKDSCGVRKTTASGAFSEILSRKNSNKRLILTEDGFKKIRDIHTNYVSSSDILRITLDTGQQISVTKNHKFLTNIDNKTFLVCADKLTTSNYLPLCHIPIECAATNGTYDLGRLIGLILAEGCMSQKNCIRLTFHEKEIELQTFVLNYAKKHFGVNVSLRQAAYEKSTHTKTVEIFGEGFRQYIKMFICGDKSYNKSLSSRAYNTSLEFKHGLIDGVFQGDAYKNMLSISSRKLRDDISYFMSLTGKFPVGIKRRCKSKLKERINDKPIYMVRKANFNSINSKFHNLKKIDEFIYWIKIKKIEHNIKCRKKIKVFDFEVESSSHLYRIANGILTHNSDVSLQGKEILNKVVDMTLRGQKRAEIIFYIRTMIDDSLNQKFKFSYIAIPVKLNKSPEEYVRTDKKSGKKIQQNRPVIRGSEWSNKNLGTQFRAGQKFKLIYVKHPETDVVCFEDDEQLNNIIVDWNKTIDKNIFQKIKGIFETLKWQDSYNTLVTYTKNRLNNQNTLF